ncbi:MAG TPA: hypothetical protein VFY93_01295 [Planctomycetota bacterium]|nr:hypothetical protein [Planctomycetota bacterium]
MREYRLDFADDLDKLGCQVPGCDHSGERGETYLHSRCHFNAPTWTSYRAGVLTVSCSVCGGVVSAIAVARRASSRTAP